MIVGRRLRVVVINQFYPPDSAPTGRYLHEVARALVLRGHSVTAICASGSYGGGSHAFTAWIDGVRILRVPTIGLGRTSTLQKLVDYAVFFAGASAALASRIRGADLVLSLTTPPWIGLFAAMVARAQRVRHAHWLMDLYPDVLAADGRTSVGGLLEALTRAELRGAAGIAAPGPCLAERAQRYSPRKTRKALVVPLWSLHGTSTAGRTAAIRRERDWRDEDLVLMYSGNLGRGHPVAPFLAAAERLNDGALVWAFAGQGPRMAPVREFAAAHRSIRFAFPPYVRDEDVADHLASADVLLASLARGWEGAIVPSKLQGMMAVGRPVIFLGEESSDAARWVLSAGCGWVVPPGDIDRLCAAVRSARDPSVRRKLGDAARRFAVARFGERNRGILVTAIERWARVERY